MLRGSTGDRIGPVLPFYGQTHREASEDVALLQVDGLTKRFGGLTAVNDFDFCLDSGELVGLIGPNGAGKTTVFNLVTGILKPDQGTVVFRGEELTGQAPHVSSTRGLVRTFQAIRLMPGMTVAENLAPAFHHQLRYSLLSSMLGMSDFLNAEAYVRSAISDVLGRLGIAEHAETDVADLPYGIQRKVDIARALCMKPSVLLLDEPTAGLNPREVDEIIRTIEYLRYDLGISLVVIEHDMRLIMTVCSRVVVMHQGGIIAQGTPAEIQANPDVARVYLGGKPVPLRN